jgi:hypothetical protein
VNRVHTSDRSQFGGPEHSGDASGPDHRGNDLRIMIRTLEKTHPAFRPGEDERRRADDSVKSGTKLHVGRERIPDLELDSRSQCNLSVNRKGAICRILTPNLVDNEIGRRNIEQMIVRDTPQEQTRPQPSSTMTFRSQRVTVNG